METQHQTSADTAPRRAAVDTLSCPNCHAALLHGMRFCRSCGYRLGEGMAEYVETMRFDGSMPPVPVGAPPPTMAQMPVQPTTMLAPARGRRARLCGNSRRGSWLVWMMVALLFAGGAGGGIWLKNLKQRLRTIAGNEFVTQPRAFFGTSSFTGTDEGVMMDAAVPNGPAERAGLIGGDIITSFDGQPVEDEDHMRKLLRTTPVGKAVEVVFVRDGETKVTTLITASASDFDGDAPVAPGRQQGFLGVDNMERVTVEGTNLHGVRLGEVSSNRPADIAGLRQGDIVVEFNGTPIRTESEFTNRIRRATPGEPVKVVVVRDGRRQEISVKMGRR